MIPPSTPPPGHSPGNEPEPAAEHVTASMALFPDAARAVVALVTAQRLDLVGARNAILREWCGPEHRPAAPATLLLAAAAFVVSYHEAIAAALDRDPAGLELLPPPPSHRVAATAARRYVAGVDADDAVVMAAALSGVPVAAVVRALIDDLSALVVFSAAVDGRSVEDRLAEVGANTAIMA